MKKTIKTLFTSLLLVLVCVFGLIACDNTDYEAILKSYIFEMEETTVTEDFVLPLQIAGVEAKWESNHSSITISKAEEEYVCKVSEPDKITEVTLTVTIGKASKSFIVRTRPINVFDISGSYAFKQDKATVIEDFALDQTATYKGKTANITWSVDDKYADYLEIVENKTCKVFVNSLNPTVQIKATFSYNGETTTKPYRMTVSMPMSALEEIDYWYTNTGVSKTMTGYVLSVATVYGPSYSNVTLYVLDESLNAGYYVYRVKCDEATAKQLVPGAPVIVEGTTNTNYKGLVETNAGGTVKIDSTRQAIDVNSTVYDLSNDLLSTSFAGVYHTSTLVKVDGWKVKEIKVKADDKPTIGTTTTLFVLENDGVEVSVIWSKYDEGRTGYYVSGGLLGSETVASGAAAGAQDKFNALLEKVLTLKVGDVVNVQGILGNRDGYQIAVVDANDITTTDATEATSYADAKKVAAAINEVNSTLKANKLDTLIVSNKEVTLPTEKDGVAISYELCAKSNAVTLDGAKFTITPTKHEKMHVQVTYKCGEYETVQFFYLESVAKTPQEMVEDASKGFEIENQNTSGVIELPTTSEVYDGVKLSYELVGETTAVTLEGNKLTVNLVEEDTVVTVKVTATYGEGESAVTASNEVSFTVKKLEPITIADFLAKKDKNNVSVVEGYVTAVNTVGEKGSFVLTDATGSIFSYEKFNVVLGTKVRVVAKYAESFDLPQLGTVDVQVIDATPVENIASVSGTAVNLTGAELASKVNGYADSKAAIADLSGKYLVIDAYMYLKDGYASMEAVSGSNIQLVNIYANKELNAKDYAGQRVIVSGFCRGYNGTTKVVTLQVQQINLPQLSAAEKLAEAKAMVEALNGKEVVADLTLPTYEGVAITWSSNNTAVLGNDGKFTAPSTDTEVTLTATLSIGEGEAALSATATATVTCKPLPVSPISDVANATKGDVLKVKGVVVNIIYKGYYVNDGTGTVLVYNPSSYPTLGQTVTVVGSFDEYKSAKQLTSSSFEVDSEVATKTAEEIAALVKANESTVAAVLASTFTASDVTKAFKVTGVLSNSGYNYIVTDGDKELTVKNVNNAHKAELTSLIGKTVTLVVSVYNLNGTPADFTYVATTAGEKQLSDVEKLAAAKAVVEALGTDYDGASNLVLPTESNGCTIAWASSNTEVVSTSGKVTLPAATTEVTLTATITLGENAPVEASFTVTVRAMTPVTIAEVKTLIDANPNGTSVCFIGKIIGADSSKRAVFADSTGVLYSYVKLSNIKVNDVAAKVGDVVKIIGTGKVFTGSSYPEYTRQISAVSSAEASSEEISLPEATVVTANDLAPLNVDGKVNNEGIKAASFYGKVVSITGTVLFDSTQNNNYQYFLADANGNKIAQIYPNSTNHAYGQKNAFAELVGAEVIVKGIIYGYAVKDDLWRFISIGLENELTLVNGPVGALEQDPGKTGGNLTVTVDGATITFGGNGETVAWYAADEALGRTKGNRVGIKVSAPTGVVVDDGFALTVGLGTASAKTYDKTALDGDNFFYYYPLVSQDATTALFSVKWNEASALTIYKIVVAEGTTFEAEPAVAGQETVVLDFNAAFSAGVKTVGAANVAGSLGLSEELFTVVGAQNSGTTVNTNTATYLRLYQDNSGNGDGGSITVTCVKKILTVVVELTSGKMGVVSLTLGGGEIIANNGEYSINANSFTIQNKFTTKIRTDIKKITIVYSTAE